MDGVKEIFAQLDFWLSLMVSDPRRLPKEQILLVNYGQEELAKLLSHYGSNYSNIYQRATSHQSADPKSDKVLAGWGEFKEIILLIVSKFAGQENCQRN